MGSHIYDDRTPHAAHKPCVLYCCHKIKLNTFTWDFLVMGGSLVKSKNQNWHATAEITSLLLLSFWFRTFRTRFCRLWFWTLFTLSWFWFWCFRLIADTAATSLSSILGFWTLRWWNEENGTHAGGRRRWHRTWTARSRTFWTWRSSGFHGQAASSSLKAGLRRCF